MDSDKLIERLATLSPAKRALLELKLQQGRGRTAAQMTIPRRAQRGLAPLVVRAAAAVGARPIGT